MTCATTQAGTHPLVSVIMPFRDPSGGLAVARRGARKVPNALRLVGRTAWKAAGAQAPSRAADFIAHQLWPRARRLG